MKQQNHYAYDIPAEYADIIDPSKVNLSDFALFLAVMKRKKAHECVLSIILGEPDLKLNQVHVEEVVLNAKGERGIRLDAWAVSEDSRHFATEMQNDSDIDDVRKRSRFYQGLLDSPILKSGRKTKYRHLPSTIVTFITQKDIFGKDRAMYTFTERCHEFPEMELEDGTKKIFLNMTSKKGRDELVSFLQYCKNSTLDNPEITVLDERLRTLDSIVSEVKQTEEWEVARMSILSAGIEIGERKGIEIGEKKGIEIGEKKGIEIGEKKGIEIGVAGLIRMGKELHLSEDVILEQICKNFGLDQATAREYLDSFEK